MAQVTEINDTRSNATSLEALLTPEALAKFDKRISGGKASLAELRQSVGELLPIALSTLILHRDARRMATLIGWATESCGKRGLEAMRYIASNLGGWYNVTVDKDTGEGSVKLGKSPAQSEAWQRCSDEMTAETLPQWESTLANLAAAEAIRKRVEALDKASEEHDFLEDLTKLVEKYDKMVNKPEYDGRLMGYTPSHGRELVKAAIRQRQGDIASGKAKGNVA